MAKRFGINITKYVLEHENYIEENRNNITKSIIDLHSRRLSYLQHERLVHLIVTFMTAVIDVMFFLLLVVSDLYFIPYVLILFVIMFILLCFYLKHYFFLENHVQYWYKLADELEAKCKC